MTKRIAWFYHEFHTVQVHAEGLQLLAIVQLYICILIEFKLTAILHTDTYNLCHDTQI